MNNETENQTRLRRAREAFISFQAAETEARKALASAIDSTKKSREKYEALFLAEEEIERSRRMKGYGHCTV